VIANRYELGRAIGSGGFATVYRARDTVENREVAIKIIPETVEEITERFRLEALALSQLRSANVARVYDFGKDEAHGLYLVMELIEGVALEPNKLGRVLLGHEVLRAARALLSGLAEAHASRLVHRDIKPANVVVPNGIAGLAELKLLDFGIAQSEHRAIMEAEQPNKDARALGTPAYMAPELLMGEKSTPASDVYSAGLVLFELLGHTLLFPDRPAREQLKARTETDPALAIRVPAPLDEILGRMLARDPERRFPDAVAALSELVNMETAPVDIADFAPPPPASVPPSPASARRRSMPPPGYQRPTLGTMRMSRLDADPLAALRTTVHALDLPMIEALARRERGTEIGRVARALSLGLRLEIDAAALVLEPLAERNDLARAVAACVLSPRARVATKARIEKGVANAADWTETVDVELGELLVGVEAALCGPEAISRCLTRCEKLLQRDTSTSSARTNVELVKIALTARSRGTTHDAMPGFDALAAADAAPSPLSQITRALLLGPLAFRVDDHTARASFERAAQLASDAGATLLEARALASWGGMLIEVPGRLQQGLTVLERVTTLLLHADVPSLEHLAAHNRGAAFIVQGMWAEAAEQFRRAREVAAGEAPLEFEILSGALELTARLAAGDRANARVVARLLELSRNVPVAPREALLVTVACSLAKLFEGDLAGARKDLETTSDRSTAGDALLLARALEVVYAAAAGETVDYLSSAAELHRTAEEHGFAAFYWFDAIQSIVKHLEDPALRGAAGHATDRLVVLLAPAKKDG
jgi:serine/threonine-protein kinase